MNTFCAEKILFINACPRPDSRTLRLARHVLDKLQGEVQGIDLYSEPLLPLDYDRLQRREELLASGSFSDSAFRYARQYAQADTILIAAPYWDLSFPSMLKTYYENIMVLGIAFRYTPEGIPEGLCRASRLIYVTTAGGPLPERDLGFAYVDELCRIYLGIPSTLRFAADNLDVLGADTEAILSRAAAEIDQAEL